MKKPTEVNYERLYQLLSSAKNDESLYKLIVNTPFKECKVQVTFLFLGIIVLLQVNPETKTIDRVALSNTDFAQRTTDVSVVPFKQIKIGLGESNNIINQAIKTKQMVDTTDWKYIFTPVLSPNEARMNQANAGIAYSAIYPLNARHGGALIYSYYQYKELLGEAQLDFMNKYSAVVDKCLNKSSVPSSR